MKSVNFVFGIFWCSRRVSRSWKSVFCTDIWSLSYQDWLTLQNLLSNWFCGHSCWLSELFSIVLSLCCVVVVLYLESLFIRMNHLILDTLLC